MISRLKNPESSALREEITNRVVEHGAREKRRRKDRERDKENCEALVRGVRERGEKERDGEGARGERRLGTTKERESRTNRLTADG